MSHQPKAPGNENGLPRYKPVTDPEGHPNPASTRETPARRAPHAPTGASGSPADVAPSLQDPGGEKERELRAQLAEAVLKLDCIVTVFTAHRTIIAGRNPFDSEGLRSDVRDAIESLFDCGVDLSALWESL